MKAVAEAPGKVIISGDHFVVHGATAVAAAIERGVRIEARKSDGLEVLSKAGRPKGLPLAKRFVQSLYSSKKSPPKVSLSISSSLAEGAGLGSSAAVMVAIASATNALEGWGLDESGIIEAAGMGEKLVHGNPSGVDATASAVGGVIMFTKGMGPRKVPLRVPITFLVAFSGQSRSTARLIARVGEAKRDYPNLFSGLTESVSLLADLCAESLDTGDVGSLGRMMTLNHAVLSRVGASTPQLDRMVDRCLELGCFGAKLTGAGGGGSVLAIPPADQGEASSVAARLKKDGYETFLTQVPAPGARAWTE